MYAESKRFNRKPSNHLSFSNDFEAKIFLFLSNTGASQTFLAKKLGYPRKYCFDLAKLGSHLR
jgi:hypothetical protein